MYVFATKQKNAHLIDNYNRDLGILILGGPEVKCSNSIELDMIVSFLTRLIQFEF